MESLIVRAVRYCWEDDFDVSLSFEGKIFIEHDDGVDAFGSQVCSLDFPSCGS